MAVDTVTADVRDAAQPMRTMRERDLRSWRPKTEAEAEAQRIVLELHDAYRSSGHDRVLELRDLLGWKDRVEGRPVPTAEMVEKTSLAMTYLEDGAREAAMRVLRELVTDYDASQPVPA